MGSSIGLGGVVRGIACMSSMVLSSRLAWKQRCCGCERILRKKRSVRFSTTRSVDESLMPASKATRYCKVCWYVRTFADTPSSAPRGPEGSKGAAAQPWAAPTLMASPSWPSRRWSGLCDVEQIMQTNHFLTIANWREAQPGLTVFARASGPMHPPRAGCRCYLRRAWRPCCSSLGQTTTDWTKR
ncbi:hypothetical protein BDP55DRAFT_166033 [Colletotrichum godetiae]|uniref:Uncharacterized protein n=1 Tax=Colletotrichum godetiae TaxID=1209918 RepID=A0AAJ0AJF1_9PEZI|nr:uncharacterized protein BDP55DRAFT_166033 [Colletotrichum godetiae]KAK1675000.1 hypothetical protein BDP55DRAFT_166033 [Colletotrichum godetiae]